MAPGADDGLATLEWLLVVAAAVGLVAALASTLQAAVDRQTDPGAPRQSRVRDADAAAVAVEHDARQALRTDPSGYDEALFAERCGSLTTVFADVVAAAAWRPGGAAGGPLPSDLPRCEVALR